MINWLSAFVLGMTIPVVWFSATHSCYHTIAGMICSTHAFTLESLVGALTGK
jgi:hypothetical protein